VNEQAAGAAEDARQVLVIEDDPAIARLVKLVLSSSGFSVTITTDGESGISAAREQQRAVVLLDMTLPGIPGREVLNTLVRECSAPVIVLTAAHSPELLLECMQAGAFDVTLKPFDPDDLEACVKLAVREEFSHTSTLPVVRAGRIQLDFSTYCLSNRFDGREAMPLLSFSEWRLLEILAAHPGQTVLYQELLGRVWGPSFRPHLKLLEAWMERLRKKVGLSEFHGIGYALVV
jgi:DNA-binding response OmpR family regulator